MVKCNKYKEKQATAKLAFVFLYLLTSKCFCEAEDNMCEAHDLRVCLAKQVIENEHMICEFIKNKRMKIFINIEKGGIMYGTVNYFNRT